MMKRVGFFFHNDYLEHDTGLHPESGNRLSAIINHVEASPILANLERLEPRLATEEEVSIIHPEPYIRHVRELSVSGGGYLDADTYVSSGSYKAALRAVGAALDGVDMVMSGALTRCFCAVRPPGHHAEVSRGMGFCLFNNVAIAAKYAVQKHGLSRVLVVDWDCHHGNGTQHIFEKDASVFYFSVHQYPHYPGTGTDSETGVGEGTGTTLNIPLPAYSGDEDYIRVFERVLVPRMDEWKPELLFISAGFDAHRLDPLCAMNLSSQCYGDMTKILVGIAEKHGKGMIVSLLEGGYHLGALAESVEAHIKAMIPL